MRRLMTGLGIRAPANIFNPNPYDPVVGYAPALTGATSSGKTNTVGAVRIRHPRPGGEMAGERRRPGGALRDGLPVRRCGRSRDDELGELGCAS